MYKHLLEVFNYSDKLRLGDKHDGGYIICNLEGDYNCYISCGVSNEASFDRDFLNLYQNIGKNNSFAFDGTIDDYPWHFTKDITFIKKNISNVNDNNHTNLNYLIDKYDKIFLSIDIEGSEYPWLLSLTQDKLKKFKQIAIEFHGINDNTWGSPLIDKIKCLEKLNQTHYIVHAHGNNHSGIENNIPDVLEITYINKNNIVGIPVKNKTLLPINGLDYPNNSSISDYKLNKYPFVDSIIIGSSETNTKIIKLDQIYPKDTHLKFIHDYKDTFTYKFNGYHLSITRTDESIGWGQDLYGYL
jgi:hypothetical protein